MKKEELIFYGDALDLGLIGDCFALLAMTGGKDKWRNND